MPNEVVEFDLQPGEEELGPELLLDPGMPEEEARMQDAVPVTYTYLEKGSRQGKDLVVSSEGHTYSFKCNLKDGGVVFRCTARKPSSCCVQVTRRVGPDGVAHYTKNSSTHEDHVTNPTYGLMREAYTLAKKEAETYGELPTSEVRKRAINQAFPDAEQRQNAPKYANLHRFIQRTRATGRPREPTAVTDPLDHAWLTRSCPDLQVVLDREGPGDSRLLVFSTAFLLQYLSQALIWCLDGTFRVSFSLFCFRIFLFISTDIAFFFLHILVYYHSLNNLRKKLNFT